MASKIKLAPKHPEIVKTDKKGKHALLCNRAKKNNTSRTPARTTEFLLQARNSAILWNVQWLHVQSGHLQDLVHMSQFQDNMLFAICPNQYYWNERVWAWKFEMKWHPFSNVFHSNGTVFCSILARFNRMLEGNLSWPTTHKIPEGVDRPNCRKCSFLIFFPTCNHGNLNIVKKDHVHQIMVKIGWPQITVLASDHLKWAHSSALGPFFIPETRYLWLPYSMRPSCMFTIKIQVRR